MSNQSADKRKIIIDTDPGHDDALALILLLQSNQFAVQAITSVAGNATIDKVTRNAQAILNLLGWSIPLYSGLPQPLQRKLVTAVVHGESGLTGFNTDSTSYQLTQDAPERIIEIVRRYPHEVTILALGPLSNLARAIQLDPALPSLVAEVVMMGGAIAVPGNKNRVAEFNFFVDPEAADIVFRAQVPKVLIPLDVCHDIVLQVDDFNQLPDSQLRSVLMPMMQHFAIGLATGEGARGLLVYDALAAYYLLKPAAYRLVDLNIVIETKGEHTFGMSVAERRSYQSVLPNVKVVQKIDKKKFVSDFFRIIAKIEQRTF